MLQFVIRLKYKYLSISIYFYFFIILLSFCKNSSTNKRACCLTSKNFYSTSMPDNKDPPKSDPTKANPPKLRPYDPEGKTGPPPPLPPPKGKETKPMPGVS